MTNSESQPRTTAGLLAFVDALDAAKAKGGYGSKYDFDLGFRRGWLAAQAEAAQDSRPLDVERLARALDLWERRADPEDESISALLGVDIYENGSVEVAQGIAAEYARLAAEKPHD